MQTYAHCNINLGKEYKLGDDVILATPKRRDLGVIITEDCKSSQQCAASTKATNKLRVITRTFKYYDKKCSTILYKAYVRPHLGYCIQALNPSLSKDIKLLERVQRKATKLR